MFGLFKRIGGVLILAGSLFLTACGSSANQSPTPDPALIYTSAAQTVEAELTLTEEANPATATITPFPFTTEAPGVPTAILGDGGVLPTLPGPQTTDVSTTLTVVVPSMTQQVAATLPQSKAADKAEWVSNVPADNVLVNTGAKFDITWQMKNTGTTTWTKKYTIRYFSGSIIMETKKFSFRDTVNPGDIGTFIVDAVAPSKPGTYNTWWKMTNDLGQNFGDMSLTIVVVKPGETPTSSPEPATPTATEEE
jgi:hypothetical protein